MDLLTAQFRSSTNALSSMTTAKSGIDICLLSTEHFKVRYSKDVHIKLA
jgi:hypothetical protein